MQRRGSCGESAGSGGATEHGQPAVYDQSRKTYLVRSNKSSLQRMPARQRTSSGEAAIKARAEAGARAEALLNRHTWHRALPQYELFLRHRVMLRRCAPQSHEQL